MAVKFHCDLNELSTPVVLERAVLTSDGQAGQNLSWVAATGTIWVRTTFKPNRLLGQGGGLVVINTTEVTLRYESAALSSGYKWRFKGPFGTLYIQSFSDPENNKRWLVCMCTELPQ